MTVKALCIDLFCGLGGWSEGFLAEGYRCVGYDVEAHDYGTGGYPGELILRDVRSIHGSEFRDAAIIVASPPCQAYSYRAMPWKRAKALPPPDNELFNACFRIQREAIEAAGRFIPLIVENVRGAQKWVGRARWNYGSFYLWGDVPALMPHRFQAIKVPSFLFDGSGRSFQSASVDGLKVGNASARTFSERRALAAANPEADPHNFWHGTLPPDENGTKQGGDWFGKNCESSMSRLYGSKSPKRKMASAMIARIPFALSSHIARAYYPHPPA